MPDLPFLFEYEGASDEQARSDCEHETNDLRAKDQEQGQPEALLGGACRRADGTSKARPFRSCRYYDIAKTASAICASTAAGTRTIPPPVL